MIRVFSNKNDTDTIKKIMLLANILVFRLYYWHVNAIQNSRGSIRNQNTAPNEGRSPITPSYALHVPARPASSQLPVQIHQRALIISHEQTRKRGAHSFLLPYSELSRAPEGPPSYGPATDPEGQKSSTTCTASACNPHVV